MAFLHTFSIHFLYFALSIQNKYPKLTDSNQREEEKNDEKSKLQIHGLISIQMNIDYNWSIQNFDCVLMMEKWFNSTDFAGSLMIKVQHTK